MQDAPASVFSRQVRTAFQKNVVALCLAGAFIAALAGPFGTYGRSSFTISFLTWFSLIFSVNLSIYVVHAGVSALWRGARHAGFYVTVFALGTGLGAASLYVIFALFIETRSGHPPDFARLVLYVGSIFGTIMLLRPIMTQLTGRTEPEEVATVDTASLPPEAPSAVIETSQQQARIRLAARLGLAPGAHILKISADGHFVEIKTCSMEVRLRMRFADAVAEVDGAEGVITHRSHWVALFAISGWVPDKHKPYVLLHDGTQVPVSKTYRQSVEALDLTAFTRDDEMA